MAKPEEDIDYSVHLARVYYALSLATQSYWNYREIARNTRFYDGAPRDGKRAFDGLSRSLTASLGLELLSFWEPPDSDAAQAYSVIASYLYFTGQKTTEKLFRSKHQLSKSFNDPNRVLLGINIVERVVTSTRFFSLRNLRNKRWGHNLELTRAEIRGAEFEEPTHKDIDTLYLVTKTAFHLLHCGINPVLKDAVREICDESRRSAKLAWSSTWSDC